MTESRDVIAAEIAQLTRVVDDPVAPYGYGSDLACLLDLDSNMAIVTGRAALVQSLVLRLITERGSNLDDPDFGIDMFGYLHRPITTRSLAELEGRIRNELRKDDRVEDIIVAVTTDINANEIRVTITAVPVDDAEQFSFTAALSDAGITLTGIANG